MIDTNTGQAERDDPVFLVTNPDVRGFIYKYILALTPLFLVVLSWIVRVIIYAIINAFFPSVIPSLTPFFPNMGSLTDMMILMIAPFGIFFLVACAGWAMRIPEVWTGSALTLALSGVAGLLLANGIGAPLISTNNPMEILQWTGFLIQPFSVVAAIIVIAWTEIFRRSIRYTISKAGVRMQGGVWRRQEHMIPRHQIGRVLMEQDRLGSIFRTGTIIPLGTSPWGSKMSTRGVDLGRNDNASADPGYAKSGQEGSRHPLDCLYGIREPEKAMALLEQVIDRPAEREEEQVSHMKKMNDRI